MKRKSARIKNAPKVETHKVHTNKAKTPPHLWKFLNELLNDPDQYKKYIKWVEKDKAIFKIKDTRGLARLWGERKNSSNMNYDKLSRSLRYYYTNNIMKKVSKAKCYQFLVPLEESRVEPLTIKIDRSKRQNEEEMKTNDEQESDSE